MLRQKQKGFAARALLFKQGGPLACELARHPVVLNVNDWIFCHGGLLPHHGEPPQPPKLKEDVVWLVLGINNSATDILPPSNNIRRFSLRKCFYCGTEGVKNLVRPKKSPSMFSFITQISVSHLSSFQFIVEYGIERINIEVSNWMQGSSEDSDDPDLPFIATRGYDSVVWTRLYSQDSVERTQRSWNVRRYDPLNLRFPFSPWNFFQLPNCYNKLNIIIIQISFVGLAIFCYCWTNIEICWS
jgi:hypothetical protein